MSCTALIKKLAKGIQKSFFLLTLTIVFELLLNTATRWFFPWHCSVVDITKEFEKIIGKTFCAIGILSTWKTASFVYWIKSSSALENHQGQNAQVHNSYLNKDELDFQRLILNGNFFIYHMSFLLENKLHWAYIKYSIMKEKFLKRVTLYQTIVKWAKLCRKLAKLWTNCST